MAKIFKPNGKREATGIIDADIRDKVGRLTILAEDVDLPNVSDFHAQPFTAATRTFSRGGDMNDAGMRGDGTTGEGETGVNGGHIFSF
jgi:hypothetical protein